ncbi:sugar phosphate isomerase/epimerase family protein [Ornithinimicrobium cavernae]|uniref:sugar phosphate isomerase/epimerase family protein n=1 Tax=Ornithinimicrobium cavernae TaxID=2666047 RepID=UPI000D69B06D|nr:sugar phosphate isomerase/epimerase family protein [Ornithinimicrobium cavernae]
MRAIGVNTWVWTSPLTDRELPALLGTIAAMGFDAVELPLEHPGDLSVPAVSAVLADTGLTPYVVGAMAPGRDLVEAGASEVRATQDYLRHCIDLAQGIGAASVCGPFYAATGRVWRMGPEQRASTLAQWRQNLAPVAAHARQAGVRIGIEPLNRYETSLINTVDQALEGLGELLDEGVGLALDTYHLNIEERSSAGAVRRAGEHVVHVQASGSDRGAPGGDQTDWPALLEALDEVGYTGPLNIESFTADNEAIATATSIWRPLAPSQDELATSGLAFLRSLTAPTEPAPTEPAPTEGEPRA